MPSDFALPSTDWIGILRNNGFRATESLRAVIRVIQESHKALSPSEIYKASRKRHPQIGLATVYRALNRLDRLGLLERVHHIQHGRWYLPAANGHSHLLFCTSCRKAEFFQCDNLSELASRISNRSGYRIEGHWLQFHGLCAKCKKTKGE